MNYYMHELKNHKDYAIRNDGLVFSRKVKPGAYTLLKPFFSGNRVCVKIDGKNQGVAKLVAETFIPNHNPNRNKVFHMDGNVSNNNVMNLEWVDSSEMRSLTKVEPQNRELYLMALRGEYYDDYIDPDDEESDEEEDDSE